VEALFSRGSSLSPCGLTPVEWPLESWDTCDTYARRVRFIRPVDELADEKGTRRRRLDMPGFKPNPFDPEMRERAVMWLNHRLGRPASSVAAAWRATLGRHTQVVAVTGSFGKTTATRAIAAALGQPPGDRTSVNSFAALYYHLVRRTGRRAHCVLEVGVGKPGQMRTYGEVIRPDVAVVTSVGLEHEKYFPDELEGIQREKAELVAALTVEGTAVLNADDPRVLAMSRVTKARVVTFGRDPGADVRLVDFEGTMEGSRLRVRVGGSDYELRVRLVGLTTASAFLTALAVAHAVDADMRRALRGLEALTPTPRRLEPTSLPGGVTALVDEYKCTPATAHAAFDTIAAMPKGRRVAVLGNIPRSTQARERALQELGRHAGHTFDRIYLTCLSDEDLAAYREGILETGFREADLVRLEGVHDAAEVLRGELMAGDLVLFKAHFSDKMSRAVLLLQGMPVRCRKEHCLIRDDRWCDACPQVLKDVG
jgi:UDP-N-acetylmuramyl pentapeptide synthase